MFCTSFYSCHLQDGTGSIDLKEFMVLMRAMGKDKTEAEAKAVMDSVDKDKNGSIDLEEFKVRL